MAGPGDEPETIDTVAAKLDRVLPQLTTMNNRLDAHDKRIARTEKFQAGDDGTETGGEFSPKGSHRRPGGGGGGDDSRDGFGAAHRGRPYRVDRGDWRQPRPPKLSFPKYDGEEDPLPWINGREIFFRGHDTMDEEKVWMASLHLKGVAAQWYFQMERDFGIVSWPRFVEFVTLRFGPPISSNALGELKALHRTSSVEDYQRHFLALLCRCDQLGPRQQIDLFTAGLGQPLASDVEMQRPSNLQTAMSLARAYELRSKEAARAINPYTTRSKPRPSSPSSSAPAKPDEPPRPRFRRLSPEEIVEKRASGQCYFCLEKFTPEHKCAAWGGVFCLTADDDGDDLSDEELRISLNALTGITTGDTIRLRVLIHGVELVALVDSGSTHTFIRGSVADRIGLTVMPRPGRKVSVADGRRLSSLGVCTATPVDIHGERFFIDCHALALDGFDIVLGVQWLKTLGPITWDFTTLTMTLLHQGRPCVWHGIGGTAVSLTALTATRDLMESLLHAYDDLFAEPTGLPPARRHDHRIHLVPGTAPIAVRPYRYPQLLKDEIERQCEEMLAQGIIRESTSPFSSPVLLVKKHDGTWSFSVDFQALNVKTVRDKFPIPVVDELLDELRGARFFTKLDLRSGYHQVRMHPDDISSTAFRTHHGHFEFLVMPFGLTNAPTTFQALMNDILKPFLRRFVLVFFDDILIYSSSWEEHVQQVQLVLQLLRDNKLFIKKSKCFFGKTSVAYLGHIISADGVAMDQAKVAAVDAWPRPRTARALRGFLGLAGYYRKFIAGCGVFVPDTSPLWPRLLAEAHEMGHEGTQKTLCQLRASFYNVNLHRFVRDFVRGFAVCQRNKTEHLHPAGLLQPLPVPSEVYDVTPFMDEHPGGDEVLLAVTGKDATADFEDIGHSDSAREMMEKYHIGQIDASTIPAKRTYVTPQQAPHNVDKDNDFLIKILQFLVPIMILGLAFGIRQYTKSE
ncbi:unnamed protein product [Urochloa decumbens]|uniref:Uncharacterized protein n=1 Tax=Urochloa decumbens TaxID=240449 RepID=A0ABC8WXZ2_9POAL